MNIFIKLFKTGVFLSALIFASVSVSQEMVAVTEEGVSALQDASEAKAEIEHQVLEKVVFKYAQDMLGEKKFEKARVQISNKIISQSGKYIPFSKDGNLQSKDGKYSMSVELKLSVASLKELLIREGLMAQSENSVAVLPMVQIIDRVNMQSYRWWLEEKSNMHDVWDKVAKKLKEELYQKNFFMIEVAQAGRWVPEVWRQESYRSEDLTHFASQFHAGMIIDGFVKLMKNEKTSKGVSVQVKMSVISSESSRLIAEVSRQLDTEYSLNEIFTQRVWNQFLEEISRDLSNQLSDSLQKGVLSANVVKLALRGDLEYKKLEAAKKAIREIVDVRNLRERMFEPGRVVFEVDIGGKVNDFARKLSELSSVKFKIISVVTEPGKEALEAGL